MRHLWHLHLVQVGSRRGAGVHRVYRVVMAVSSLAVYEDKLIMRHLWDLHLVQASWRRVVGLTGLGL